MIDEQTYRWKHWKNSVSAGNRTQGLSFHLQSLYRNANTTAQSYKNIHLVILNFAARWDVFAAVGEEQVHEVGAVVVGA